MKKQLLFISLSLASTLLFGQSGKIKGEKNTSSFVKCGTEIPNKEWKESFQQDVSRYIANNAINKSAKVIYNIPVIMHIIHNNANAIGTGDNISLAQAQSQIQVLNDDYAGIGYNASTVPTAFSGLVANCEVNFVLAQRDALGNQLATPGVDRVSYQSKTFTAPGASGYSTSYINNTIKPNTIWDVNKYLNVWILDLDNNLLGYATFPPSSTLTGIISTFVGTTTTDGFVNDYLNWGVTAPNNAPYNRGRTATHEIGHWLGLLHIWGDGGNCAASDYCPDTPPQQGGFSSPAGSNYGCPTYPSQASTCTRPHGVAGANVTNTNGDMFMNFMDYTDDECMYMFTNDQKTRIVTSLTNSPMRMNVVSTSNLSGTPVVGVNAPVASFTSTPNSAPLGTSIALNSTSINTPTAFTWYLNPAATGLSISNASLNNATLTIGTNTIPGTYSVCLIASNINGADTVCNNITVTGANTSCDTLNNFDAGSIYSTITVNIGGYVAGQNGYLDAEKAERYNYPSGNINGITISGVYFLPVVAKGTGNTAFKVYEENTTTLLPGLVKANQNAVNNTFTANTFNTFNFTTPINIASNKNFYVGIGLNYATGDTMALALSDVATNNTAFEKWSGTLGAWYPFNSASAWGSNFNMAIFPIYCPTAFVGTKTIEAGLYKNVFVYPNPSNGIFNTALTFDNNTNVTIVVKDITGKVLLTQEEKSITSKVVKIDLNNQAAGVYLLTVKTINGITTKRLIIAEK